MNGGETNQSPSHRHIEEHGTLHDVTPIGKPYASPIRAGGLCCASTPEAFLFGFKMKGRDVFVLVVLFDVAMLCLSIYI